MITVRLDRLGAGAGELVLDVGAGFGRHAFAVARRGASVVAIDWAHDEVASTRATFAAMAAAGEIAPAGLTVAMRADACALPFADAAFDRVVTSEVLEHVGDDIGVIAELARVLRPGGVLAVTVPSWWPEVLNWRISDEYHAPKSPGGHVRIYAAAELRAKLRSAGMRVDGSHRAHALHSPYWWLRCAVGVANEGHPAVVRYRRLLEWEIVHRPLVMRAVERFLSPILGKSYVVYATKGPA